MSTLTELAVYHTKLYILTFSRIVRPFNDDFGVSEGGESSAQPMPTKERGKRYLEINRLDIKLDLIRAFSDTSILKMT